MSGYVVSSSGHDQVDGSPQSAVVVAYDGSGQAAAAVRWAAREAALSGYPLEVVVACRPEPPADTVGPVGPSREHATALARAAAAAAARLGGRHLVVRQVVQAGWPPSVILERCHGARLMVMGTAGHLGRLGGLRDSVSREVIEHSDIPVVLIGPEAPGYVESRIVVPSRFGVADAATVAWAVSRARTQPGATLHLLDSWSPPALIAARGEGPDLDALRHPAALAHEQAMASLRAAAAGVPVTGALFQGKPPDVEYAHGLPGDLLVVSAGDVVHRPSLTRVRCPVAAIPPAEDTHAPGLRGAVDAGSRATSRGAPYAGRHDRAA